MALVAMASVAVKAQDCCSQDNTPQKNDFTAAVTLEYNSYFNVNAKDGASMYYSAEAINNNPTNKKLMVGLEFGWFMNENWKLGVGGGFNFSNNPGYMDIPGTGSNAFEGEINGYPAIAEGSNFNFRVYLESDRYFCINNVKNLTWYTGLRVTYGYAQDRAKLVDQAASWLGRSVADGFNLGGAIVLGTDYFVTKGLFVGASIIPVGYTFNQVSYVPQPGLASLKAQSNDISVLAIPTLKLGFKF